MSYQWDFAAIWPYRMLLLEGLWGTIQIGVTSILFGMLAGIALALMKASPLTLSPFAAAVLALSAQSAAFYAEVYRGGIQSIGAGQWEGAKALGMSRATALRRVIFPQALRRMIPPFLERSFELLKSTALASSLAYSELLYQAMQINSQTYRPLEVYSLIAVMYFTLLLIISQGSQLLERRLAVSDTR